MKANEIQDLLQTHFGDQPGYDANASQEVANALANASAVVAQQGGGGTITAPTQQQKDCYAKCQRTRDAAMAAAALKGFPLGLAAVAAAIAAFNACRNECNH
jgi:CTP:molybdopterin cytidylyltransferase MocA